MATNKNNSERRGGMDTLIAFGQRCADMAKSAFTLDSSLDGTVLLFAETDNVAHNALWGLRFVNDNHKHQMLLIASGALNYRNTKRYAVMSLAWLSSDAHPKPSEDPNRKEVMMVAIAELLGGKQLLLWDVARDASGGITGLTENWSNGVHQPGGQMFELLMRHELVPHALGVLADIGLAPSLLSGTTLNHPATSAGH